jgi:hypothetical protein
MGSKALRRRAFARKLVTRWLDQQAVRLARRNVQDGASSKEEYVAVAVLPCNVTENVGLSRSIEGGKDPTSDHVAVFEASADVRASDMIVLGATAILNPEGGPITYTGGERLEVKSVSGLTDDPTHVAAVLIRRSSRRPQ